MARFSTLALALTLASPALWAALVTRTMDLRTALIRLLIAIPVAALMLGVVRLVTSDYGRDDKKKKSRAGRTGEDEPALRAEAVAGEPFTPKRRSDEATP